MSSSKKMLGNDDVALIIQQFAEYLQCSAVGRRFGSKIYFDMGPSFKKELTAGVIKNVGSSTIILEGYDWVILRGDGRVVTSANAVSDEVVKKQLEPMFIHKSLEYMIMEERELRIGFSGNIRICSKPLASGEYIDDKLCLWVLPDGRVLGCDTKVGFYMGGSISKAHARHYAEAAV